jgi:hypothetical protein
MMRGSGTASLLNERIKLVRRRCQACKWTSVVAEPLDADPPCPWCHGSTAITEVLQEALAIVPSAPGGKNPYAAALGRLGGIKGGRARAERLSKKRRTEIARKAARARWRKKPTS